MEAGKIDLKNTLVKHIAKTAPLRKSGFRNLLAEKRET
jgi:hypothetical protein